MIDSLRIALVVSRFNQEITDRLREGAVQILEQTPYVNHDIYHVPGAVEIPLTAQRLAQKRKHKAIICLGAVIRGETNHYDHVCSQVSLGCQMVALQTGVPVVFGVLTTDNEEQAFERVGGIHGHKGAEAAYAALEMIKILENIEGIQ